MLARSYPATVMLFSLATEPTPGAAAMGRGGRSSPCVHAEALRRSRHRLGEFRKQLALLLRVMPMPLSATASSIQPRPSTASRPQLDLALLG